MPSVTQTTEVLRMTGCSYIDFTAEVNCSRSRFIGGIKKKLNAFETL